MTPTPTSTKTSKAPPTTPSGKAPRKTLTTSRKKTAAPAALIAMTADPPIDVSGMIATAAFYLAAERSFAPGHELDDWLEAERRIRAQYG